MSVAIVTGGRGGMGPSIGVELARRGVGTIVFAQRRDAGAAVAAAEAAGARAVSMALDVGSAAGVVKFHSSPPLALIARMEPPAVPSTLSPAACAAVTPAMGEPAVLTTHTTSPVVRLSAKALLPHSAST